jgi:hypothetical protein
MTLPVMFSPLLPGPYLPWGAGAMRPAGLAIVCDEIALNRRRRVVERGSHHPAGDVAHDRMGPAWSGDAVAGCLAYPRLRNSRCRTAPTAR